MKKIRKTWPIGLALLAVGTIPNTNAGEGGASTVGGGGHSVPSRFQETAHAAYLAFERACDSQSPAEICSILSDFGNALLHISSFVPAKDLKGPDGQPREAWTENSVTQVDVDKIPALQTQKDGVRRYVRVVIHEVCVNGGLEAGDTYNKCSDPILQLFDREMIDLGRIAKFATSGRHDGIFRAEVKVEGAGARLKAKAWAKETALQSCYEAGYPGCIVKAVALLDAGFYCDRHEQFVTRGWACTKWIFSATGSAVVEGRNSKRP